MIWKSYLAPTCFSWEKRGKEKNWLSLISWASLSPAGSYNIAAALSPWSKADTHPLSAGSTDCHSSCQSTAIYLEAWGLLKRGKSRGWREMMMKGWDEGEERSGSKRKQERKSDEAGQSLQPRYRLDLGFSISISVTERAARLGIEKENLRDVFHVGLLWSLSGFWQQKWSRRREGEEETEEGIRSCFDNLSPSLFSLLRPTHPTATTKYTPLPSEPLIWQEARALGLAPVQKPLKSIRQATLRRHKTTEVISSPGAALAVPPETCNTCPAMLWR